MSIFSFRIILSPRSSQSNPSPPRAMPPRVSSPRGETSNYDPWFFDVPYTLPSSITVNEDTLYFEGTHNLTITKELHAEEGRPWGSELSTVLPTPRHIFSFLA
ncbi:hypothetical protein LIER_42157 [Lithospermum erythrorhizon]|uniref:Uncharacterized protein n=1 Tax=Lithospermum erythrorhizon TaxID=34254 RepID=A0AAV3RNK0_LITER